MKKLLLISLTPVLLTAGANPRTVKLVISGPTLSKSIEVTDPRILEISKAWSRGFIDMSRSPIDEPPQGRPWYEVSIYSEIAKEDVRKACVVYYYPSDSSGTGLLYLPGSGAVWELNVGTIMMKGRDGKWNYALPAWEALVKPFIANAARNEDTTPKTFAVKTGGWTRPKSGWLYVLDPHADGSESRVWLLDPETEMVMGSIRAGYRADIALSADGNRLYIVSGERESGELSVVDTERGAIRHVPFPNRVLYTPWYISLPPFSPMTVSSDGTVLRILGQRMNSPDNTASEVLTFDTERERFLASTAATGKCGGFAGFVPSSTRTRSDVLCPWTNQLHSIRFADDGSGIDKVVDLPGTRRCSVSSAFLLADNTSLALIHHDGSIHEMDMATQEVKTTAATRECAGTALVYGFQWPRSPGGERIYIGYGPSSSNNMSTSSGFRVYDTVRWQQIAGIETSIPFWSAITNNDGALIYALAPEQHKILVIDAFALKEIKSLSIGNHPALALVAP